MREKDTVVIYRVIKALILETLNVTEDKVSIDTRFGPDLDADSLDIVEILMQLEDKYGIEIPEETAQNIKTVRQMVEYMEQRL